MTLSIEVAAGSEIPPHLSPSSMSTYQQCPLRYKLEKIDKLDSGDTIDTLRGNYVHDVLEALFNLAASERTIDTAKVLLREQWDREWGEKVTDFLQGDERALRTFRWESFWRVENYFQVETPSTVIPEGVEVHTETKIFGEIAGVLVLGYVDRWVMTDVIDVTDYKTGKTPAKRFQAPKFLQLLIYADYLATQYGMPLGMLTLLFLKDAGRITKQVTEQDIAEMRETLVTVRSSIESDFKAGRYLPRTSVLCDWCNFKSQCPAHN